MTRTRPVTECPVVPDKLSQRVAGPVGCAMIGACDTVSGSTGQFFVSGLQGLHSLLIPFLSLRA